MACCKVGAATVERVETIPRSAEEHIAGLLDQLDQVPHRDHGALDALLKRTEMIVRNVFGRTSNYLTDVGKISFSPWVYPADEAYYNSSWNSGIATLRNLLNTMAEEVQLFGISGDAVESADSGSHGSPVASVFLVHGHDDRAKVEVARFMEKLGLDVIILHERTNAGQTIIEKFEREASGVAFAVVLLTADDIGSPKGSAAKPVPRARQNVVFEHGYFIAKLGRSNVAALMDPSVEAPSDYSGVVYIPLVAESWKLLLAKEIKGAGIEIDLNKAA
jgi:hypothetical protein